MLPKEIIEILLKDRTTGKNIIWGADNYRTLGSLYKSNREITTSSLTHKGDEVIMPRVAKPLQHQKKRVKEKAEVFTPSWVCSLMIENLLKDQELEDLKKDAWKKFVEKTVLEITCGEAPFLVSRYDTVSGEMLDIENRIGILDKKLKLISANIKSERYWFEWVIKAYKSTYGYEWQGDNLFLARKNLVLTFVEYYEDKFNKTPSFEKLQKIAEIVSWNLWQMDGLKFVIPNSCKKIEKEQPMLFSGFDELKECPGCTQNDNNKHTGIYSKIMNWETEIPLQFYQGGFNMKFDYVIGNPPYQENTSNNKMSRSVYPIFVENAKHIGNIVTLIIPARWMSGESGPYNETNGFIKSMIGESHLKSFTLYPNSTDLFPPTVDIKGGVCFFVWDAFYNSDLVDYVLSEKGKKNEIKVSFKIADNIIIRFPELISILEKSRKTSAGSMKTLVSSRNPFGFVSDLFKNNNEKVAYISEKKVNSDDLAVWGLLNTKRVLRYIPNNALKKNREGADSYKVFLPRANGSGVFGEVFSTPMIGTPMMICTDTFLQIGCFDKELYAKNLLKYVKTKYFRAMVGIRKTAVFNYKDCFEFVPLQDFTEKSDIDWSKSIHEIDIQLYKKYGLNEEEIDFIETHVKEML